MAYASKTTTVSISSVLAYRVVNFVTSFGEEFADWRKARATRRALSRLSDHQLEDIGLKRGDF